MKVKLSYGKRGLDIELPEDKAHFEVIRPKHVPAVSNPKTALREAILNPIGTQPLPQLVNRDDTVAIVFSDITRPTPNHLILPEILSILDFVPDEQIILCNALGTHRPNTIEELSTMLGDELVNRYRIVQNNCFDPETQVYLGKSSKGHDQWINQEFMNASVKILTGFIEPHFFAGFSGGGKAVMPGMAGQMTVLGNHDAGMIGDLNATYGVTHGNPIWEEAREIALMTNPTFLLNVTLNSDKQITGVFAGDLESAHDAGIEFVRDTAMIEVDDLFDIVITTNSGYPLDMNLYQCGKGMSAAEQIIKPDGKIIIAAECSEGIPEHGLYATLLSEASTPQELFDNIMNLPHACQDQWAAQIQARIQLKSDVFLYSDGLTDEQITNVLLTPCRDIEHLISDLIKECGSETRIGILPEGPQTIPYRRKRKG